MRSIGHTISSSPKSSTIKLRIARISPILSASLKQYEITITLETNFTTRPITLLVDTGAQITIIADDIVTIGQKLIKQKIQLTGFDGGDSSASTKGMLNGKFLTNDGNEWPVEAHVVDRKTAGPYDGYLGYDFLQKYNSIIDLAAGTVHIRDLPGMNEKQSDAQDQGPDRITAQPPSAPVISIEPNDELPTRDGIINNQFINSDTDDSSDEEVSQTIVHAALIHSEPTPITEENSAVKKPNSPQIPENTQDYAERQNRLTFLDTDDQITKLQKIEQHGVKLNKEATAYIRAFGTKKLHVSRKNHKKLQQYKVHHINTTQTRAEIIFAALDLSYANEAEKRAIWLLVHKYPNQFFIEGDVLAKTDLAEHEIHLKPNTGIIHVKQFRLPQTQQKAIKQSTQEMYDQQIIRDSKSPFNAPTFMVKKKNAQGEYTDQRQVHDYRDLNKHTIVQDFPIPRIQELVDNFAQSQYISKIDIKSAFHQVAMHEPHKQYTAFTVGYHKYEFERLPFGLRGGPITMQSVITRALNNLLDNGVSAYMDDVSTYTKTFEEHIQKLDEVFSRLKKHNLQANIKKCNFFTPSVEYLGFIIERGQVRPNPNKVKAIRNYPLPKTRKQLKSFLGMLGYYSVFIKNYAHIAKPLHSATSTQIKFAMNTKEIEAFEKLKTILADDVTLKIVDFTKKFIVATDASIDAIGAILAQPDGKADRPIQFFSRVLNEHERNYPAHELELLALTCAIAEFETYLFGRQFTVLTDSQCLVYLFSNTHKNKRLVRQAISILDANFDIRYQPGKLNVVADALSRIELPIQDEWVEIPITEFIQRHCKTSKQIRAITRSRATAFDKASTTNKIRPFIICTSGLATERSDYDHIFSVFTAKNKQLIQQTLNDDNFDKTTTFIQVSNKHSFTTINSIPIKQTEIKEIIYKIHKLATEEDYSSIAINLDLKGKNLFEFKYWLNQIFDKTQIAITLHINTVIELVDTNEIQEALRMHHHLRLGGHAGIERMTSTMKKIYHWPTMVKDIKTYVSQCSICERAKITKYTKTPMLISSTGEAPFDHIYIDYVGPISPPSNEGHKYIFVATCDLTAYSIAIPTVDMTAKTTAEVYIKHIILQFGFPAMVSSDRGTDFMSDLFKQVNKILKIKQTSTTPYNPRANIVERRNRSTSEYLKCYTEAKPDTWAELLPYCTFAYNITVNVTTGFTPFELVYGKTVSLPDSILRNQPIYNYENYAHIMKKELRDAWNLARDMVNKKKEQRKKTYDKNVNDIHVQPGDQILIKKHVKNRKFDMSWVGPFEVTEVPNSKYVLYKDKKNLQKKIGKDHIKLAKANYFITKISENDNNMINYIYTEKRKNFENGET